MTLAGMLPSPSAALGPWLDEFIARIEAHGTADWVQATMAGRMGASLSPAALAWWTQLMSAAPPATVLASLRMLPTLHGPAAPRARRLPHAVHRRRRQGATGQLQPATRHRGHQGAAAPGAAGVRLEVVDADSFHISATHPDACAALTARFLDDIAPLR